MKRKMKGEAGWLRYKVETGLFGVGLAAGIFALIKLVYLVAGLTF